MRVSRKVTYKTESLGAESSRTSSLNGQVEEEEPAKETERNGQRCSKTTKRSGGS